MASCKMTNFENLLLIYKPEIEEDLNPRDLLPYLPEWCPDNDCISNVQEFMKYILHKLRNTDDVAREFKQFLNALDVAGYTSLHKLLSGEDSCRFDKFKRLLRYCMAPIRKRIKINETLLNELRADSVITQEEKEEIMEIVDKGKLIEALYALIKALPRHSETWSALFIKALHKTGNDNTIQTILEGENPDDPYDENEVEVADQEQILRKLKDMGEGFRRPLRHSESEDVQLPASAVPMPINNLNASSNTFEGAYGNSNFDYKVTSGTTKDVNFENRPGRISTTSGAQGKTGVEDKPEQELKLRLYQRELAHKGMEGQNVIICAPTGSGKTRVALAIAKHHLENARENIRPCVVFVVDRVNLIQQQLDAFKPYLPPSYNPGGLSGKKMDQQVDLYHTMSLSKVIFLTAQVLLNALEMESTHNEGVVSISDFSLLIFDECHNTTKKHPYNQIMKHYLKAKHEKKMQPQLPQIVGLTASLGVGGAGSTDGAIDHIEKMCANLDATELCVVNNHRQDLLRYVAEPGIDLRSVRAREDDPCKLVVCEHMGEIHQEVLKQLESDVLPYRHDGVLQLAVHFKQIPSDFGSQSYTNWVARLGKLTPDVDDKTKRMRYMTFSSYLKMYHEALNRNAQARMKDALIYLSNEAMTLKQPHADATVAWLEKSYHDINMKLSPIMDDPRYENPLLRLLKVKIMSYSFNNSADSRGIIFVQTRPGTGMIQSWMDDDEQLSSFKPAIITGTSETSPAAQEEILDRFKKGEHKCLISTSVTESGVDVPLCNWVIRYNHTTNEIALVQAKGRARQSGSQYAVVAIDTSGKVRKEQTNQVREMMMDTAANEVSQMPRDVLERRIGEIQVKELERHLREAVELKKRPFVSNDYDILCKKCRVLVTNSGDLRIRNNSHHTSISEGFKDRYVKRSSKKPVVRCDFETHFDVLCKDPKCNSQWGKLAILSGVELPLLAADRVVYLHIPTGECNTRITKWKQFQFTIPEY